MSSAARVTKLISRAGMASRREAERMIREGRVAVNGRAVDHVVSVTPNDRVTVNGVAVPKPARTRVWIAHKLNSELVTRTDPQGRPTLFDRLATMGFPHKHVMAVGRLDLKTEGLILLTNDGEFKRFMEHPKSDIPRRYHAQVYGDVNEAWLRSLRQGAVVDDVRYRPVLARVLRQKEKTSWLEIVLREGKNREVRNVLKHTRLKVTQLIRTDFGPYSLHGLPRGALMEVPLKRGGIGGYDPDRADALDSAEQDDDERHEA